MKNQLLEEIHAFREKNSEKFNNDLNLIVDDLKKYEKSQDLKIISLEKKSPQKQLKVA